jgi:subtilisin
LNQIKGIEYAIEHADEIDVLNISIENKNSASINRVIDQAVKAGITVVVGAGNYGQDASNTSPANNPNIVSVSAIADIDGKCGGLGPSLPDPEVTTTKDDTFAYFSNFGPVVKIAVPGVDILSTINGTDYGIESGTSIAAPHVSGAAALYKLENPDAPPSEVMSMILNSSSTPETLCDGGPQGYFTGDLDNLAEPLLYRQPILTSPITPSSSISPVVSRPIS